MQSGSEFEEHGDRQGDMRSIRLGVTLLFGLTGTRLCGCAARDTDFIDFTSVSADRP